MMIEEIAEIKDYPELLYGAMTEAEMRYKDQKKKVKDDSKLTPRIKSLRLKKNEGHFNDLMIQSYAFLEHQDFPTKNLNSSCKKDMTKECIDSLFENAKRLNKHIKSNPHYKPPEYKLHVGWQ